MSQARRVFSGLDRPLLFVFAVLCALGLYNLASAQRTLDADLHVAQSLYLMIGVGLMLAVVFVDYRNFEALAIPCFVLVVGLLALTLAVGKVVNGSRRWLPLGLFNLQTADLAKLAVILIVAKIFHTRRPDGALTLNEIFQPLAVSRPLLMLTTVILFSVAGDTIRPAKLESAGTTIQRTLARLKPSVGPIRLGSEPGVEVRLRYAGVAGVHAEVRRLGEGAYVIRDLTGEGATYVNGQVITGTVALHHGDIIRLGLSPRAQLGFRASTQRIQLFLPYLAILGTLWLFASMVWQYRKREFALSSLVAPIDVVALPFALILVQPDLGTSMVLAAVAMTMILYVGLEPLSLLFLSGFSVLGSALAWLFVLRPYQKMRVLTFLQPDLDLAGAGYHQHQSLIAVGSGGMGGKGYRQGTQTQFSFLPEQQTDFIFSVWAEEQGFVGCAVVAALFGILVFLCFRTAQRSRDRFGALLAVGVTAMIFWHAVINMFMVLQLAPVVGVPLPLWSYGGSFLITTLIGMGMVLNVGVRRKLF